MIFYDFILSKIDFTTHTLLDLLLIVTYVVQDQTSASHVSKATFKMKHNPPYTSI